MEAGANVGGQVGQANQINRKQDSLRSGAHVRSKKAGFGQRWDRNRLRDEVVTTIPSERQVDSFHRPGQSGTFERCSQNSGRRIESLRSGENTIEVVPLASATTQCNPQINEIRALENSMGDLNLRESLIEQLRSGSYTCLICLSNVEPRDQIWSCSGCYHVYHLSCISNWALSNTQKSGTGPQATQKVQSSWRCPACQKSYTSGTTSLICRCFCGKIIRPEYRPGFSTIPHGCDEVCGRSKANTSRKADQPNKRVSPCPHTCTELCHPGPCPPCTALVQLHCPCGRVVQTLRCGEEPPEPCGAPCDRLLPAGRCAYGTHHCPLPCHDGDCPPCTKLIKSVCYCGRVDEVTLCGSEKAKRYDLCEARSGAVVGDLELYEVEMFFDGAEAEKAAILATEGAVEALFVGTVFSCEQTCDRPLACGHHNCTALCHPGDCRPCPLLPSQCLTCPCGRVRIAQLVMNGDEHGNRKKCTDPIPVCPNVCGRPNPICGHPCPEKCHPGPSCPPCKLTTKITCRCGKTSKEISCLEYALAVKKDPDSFKFLCGRICRKKKSCGRHKCNRKCCDMVIHACQEICGRTLACGKHTCEDLCHCGPCGPCWRGVINEEVYCHCGATVLPPPQPCGTAPPECNQPCSRPHPCDHPVQHTCHSEPECPKCTVLMTKRCPGDHTWMFNVPCFQAVVTCGRPCDKPLSGCSHRCRRQCHAGDCLLPSEDGSAVCTQPCATPRPDCGHPCGQPCHEAAGIPCVEALGSLKCHVPVTLSCTCGHRCEEQPCYRVKTLVAGLAKKDPNFLLRCSASTALPFGLPSKEVLPCDSSCTQAMREAKAAEEEAEAATHNEPKMWVRGGTHVIDESLPPAFAPPEYSDWLKQFASNNLSFAVEVEKVLYNLVDETLGLMKSSGSNPNLNKCVSHRFSPMNHAKRRFIIELAEFYGVECVELDPPPHRYVEALAIGGRVRFPGGGSKQHYVSLAGRMEASFVGSVKIGVVDAALTSAPVHVAARPAPLRCTVDTTATTPSTRLVSFSSVVGSTSYNSGNRTSKQD
ncbi:Transcriptional repressor NF-X1 [Echinococcus granulosus]|uniref:Transcriptional repressor NF-X1 n=1 Tax=Echinococcus granulosus TaxID=6210 RepID=W6VE02_ECHGR|nr:Transcriptional repressor NF-X1 [Echinococcus granulosus]EUB65019.1 Transcriptional repressor NF-X1 [Echinococcus granulosus]